MSRKMSISSPSLLKSSSGYISPEPNFVFSEEFSHRILSLLRKANETDPINLVLSDFSFNFVYEQCCKKLTIQKPTTAQYLDLMYTDNLIQIAQLVMWISLYDTINENILQNDIRLIHQRLYDRLSLAFYSLSKQLQEVSSMANQRLIDYWSSAICATILQLTVSEFKGSETDNNYEFVETIERGVRKMLLGFPPANILVFHESVLALISLKAQKLVPKTFTPSANLSLFDTGNTTTTELIGAMTIENHYETVHRRSQEVVFKSNSGNALIQNAMRLTGMKEPVEAKGLTFRKGTTEVSNMVMKKCSAIMDASLARVSEHADDRDLHLLEICDSERACNKKLRDAKLKSLGVTFENFGYNPMYGRLVLGGLPPPADLQGSAKMSWRAQTKVVRKPKPEKTINEIISTIKEAHPVILRTGIA